MGKPKQNQDPTWSNLGKSQAATLADKISSGGESVTTKAMRESQKQSLGNALAGISTIGGISQQLKNRLGKNQAATIGAQTQALEDQIKLEEKAQNEALLAQHLAQMQGTQLTDQQTAMQGYNIGAQSRVGLAKGLGSALVYAGNQPRSPQQTGIPPAQPIPDYSQLQPGQYYA